MPHTKKTLLLVGASLIALAGCSHSNPLNQYSHEQVARDLLSSAVTAEMKLGLAKQAYQAGYYYSQCIAGKKPQKTCRSVYKAMWENLKPKYKGLMVADLQDKKIWSFIKEDYQEAAFNRLPG